ncbi:MAG: hypothetical protein PHQ74_12750 [Crocinitomicaceae bacterium]|nr:hypothetical protein [Crocinitomicaceae bacterium]
MSKKSVFDFSKYTLQKPSAGHLIRSIIYLTILIVLLIVIYWLFTKQVRQTKTTPYPTEINNVTIELEAD